MKAWWSELRRRSWGRWDSVDRVGIATCVGAAIVVVLVLLTGCAPTKPAPSIVEVPVEVPCVSEVPDVSCPAWPEGDDRARVIEWRVRWGEAREAHRLCELATVVLRETIAQCTTTAR